MLPPGLSNLPNLRLTEDFPEELHGEILRRLPVQCLLRLRCVCKIWKCLIDSSTFIQSHLSKNSNSKIYLFLSGLGGLFGTRVNFSGGEVKFAEVDLLNRSGGLVFQSLTLPLPLNRPSYPSFLRVYGSCNGLICFSTRHFQDMSSRNGPSTTEFLLVNPSTREYLCLLPPISLLELWCGVGLGYDCSADEYKFVVIPREGTEVYIYGSKSNTWRQINVSSKYEDICYSGCYGKYTHGALHWLGSLSDLVSDSDPFSGTMNTVVIVKFDLVSEKFTVAEYTVAEYNSDTSENFEDVFLEVLGGQLCLCFKNYVEDADVDLVSSSIWVMEEYGVRESWSKLGSFGGHITPLAFSNGGRSVLLQRVLDSCSLSSCSLDWYDPDTEYMGCINTGGAYGYNVCMQSLIRLERKLPIS